MVIQVVTPTTYETLCSETDVELKGLAKGLQLAIRELNGCRPSTVAVFVKRPYMIRMINKFNSLNRIVNQIHQVIKENFNESTVILTRETAGNKVNDILKEKLMETLDSNARQEDLPVDPKKMKAIVKTKVIDLWQDWWRSFDNTRDRTGLHTRRYIPSIHERLKWKYFEPSFVLTQYITKPRKVWRLFEFFL